MLCLSRSSGKQFVIVKDGEIILTIFYPKSKNKHQGKFGFKAASDIKIYRAEVWERMVEQGEC